MLGQCEVAANAAQLASQLREQQKKLGELQLAVNEAGRENAVLKAQLAAGAPGIREPLKVPAPHKYDGSQVYLKSFLAQCRLYFEFQAGHLSSEADRTLVAIGYLKGAAFMWAEPYLTNYLDHKDDPNKMDDGTRKMFQSFDGFGEALKSAFDTPGRNAGNPVDRPPRPNRPTRVKREFSNKYQWPGEEGDDFCS